MSIENETNVNAPHRPLAEEPNANHRNIKASASDHTGMAQLALPSTRKNARPTLRRFVFTVFLLLATAGISFGFWQGKLFYEQESGWELLFADDFSVSTLNDRWQIRGGQWTVANGILTGTSEENAFLVLKIPCVGDVRIEADVRFSKLDEASLMEAAFFCNAGKTELTKVGYFASLGSKDGVKLQRRDFSVAVNREIKPEENRWFNLRLERVGGRVVFHVDHKPTAQYDDPAPITGGMGRELTGLYLWRTRTEFTNVRVWNRGKRDTVSILETGHVLYGHGYFAEAAKVYGEISRSMVSRELQTEAAYRQALALTELVNSTLPPKGRPHLPNAEQEAHLAQAAEILDALLVSAPAPFRQYARIARAEVEYLRGNFELAVETAVKDAEQDKVLKGLLRPFLSRHVELVFFARFNAAEMCVDAIERLYVKDDEETVVTAIVNCATAMARMGRSLQGRVMVTRLLDKYSSQKVICIRALQTVAGMLANEGKHKERLAVAERLLRETEPHEDAHVEALNIKAASLRALGRYAEAMAVYDSMLTQFADRRELCCEVILIVSQLHRETGKTKEALNVLQDLTVKYANLRQYCATALMERAKILRADGNRREAEDVLDAVSHEYADLRDVGGNILLTLHAWAVSDGRYADAETHCDQLADKYKGHAFFQANALVRKGLTNFFQGRYEESVRLFDRVLQEYPAHPTLRAWAAADKGRILALMGKTTEAITVLEDALFEFENQRFYAACYHAFLADIHLQLGNDEKALRHVENLKEKYPEQRRYLGQGLLAEGHARLRAGNERTAVACWERARDDFPDFHDTLLSAELNLAKLSREKGLIEEALQRLIELEKLPRNQASLPHARIEAARLETLLSAGDLPEAEIVAQNIINRHFKHRVECAAALAHLSGILTCAGKFEEAEKAFARIENDFPEQRGARSEMMAYQLLAAYWHDDFNSAKRLCDQLLSNYSDQRHACATALSVTAALRRRDGHWDDAIAILENIAQARWERLMTTAMSMTERCMTEYMAQRPMRAHAVFLNILGQQGLLSEVFAKALKFSEETTIEDSPAHPLFLRNDLEFARALAWCFMKGNEERAVAHLRLCLEKTPGKVKMAWPAPAAKELLTFLEKSLARKKGRRVGAE